MSRMTSRMHVDFRPRDPGRRREVQLVERHSNRHHGDGSGGSDPPETSSSLAQIWCIQQCHQIPTIDHQMFFLAQQIYHAS